MKLYEEIKKLEALEAENDKAEELMVEYPDNDEYETAFDETYKAAWDQAQKIVERLVERLGIDSKVARAMLHGKREKLVALAAQYNGEF